MGRVAKAYLNTEGKVEYKGCEVGYYTYSIDDKPKKYNINVNVLLRSTNNEYTVSLAIDKSFSTEDEAVTYGTTQGKRFIDNAIKEGRLK